jgi:hypothetical protein
MSEKQVKDAVRRRPIPLPDAVKDVLRSFSLVERAWTGVRRAQVHREYRQRRERYQQLAAERGVVYREDEVVKSIRARIARRGYVPPARRRGEIHTFAFIPMYGWHAHLLPDLRELGPLTLFDYESLGYSHELFRRIDGAAARLRNEVMRKFLLALHAAHAERPIDWILFYAGGQEVSPVVLRQISEELGVPTANFSFDDKQGWAGVSSSSWRTGAVDITGELDLYATSARVACEWHLLEGGRPIYMPEGFDASAYCPRDLEQDIDVSFVGSAYGPRQSVVRFLLDGGVRVTPFGHGWRSAGWTKDPVEIFNRSRINLGIGGIEYSESLTNVKGRDFEIPGTGGGMYLTTFNPDLALHFKVGDEIVCYRNRDEMLELIRWYLLRPDEASAIAARGRARALREHRWLHRYETMLRIFGVLPEEGS